MSKINIKKTEGTLNLHTINFSELCETNVKPVNHEGAVKCGRIYLPKELVGKRVIVIVKPDEEG